MEAKIPIKTYCIIETTLPMELNRSLSFELFFVVHLLTNPKIKYCPTAKITLITTKIAMLDSVELSPPVIAEILTIDISTIKAIIMEETRMKMPLVPILLWNLFKPGLLL